MRSSHVGISSCMHVHVDSRRSLDQVSGEIDHNDHKASRSSVLVIIRVFVRSMVPEGIHFRKKLIFGRNMFLEETSFRKECISKSIVLSEGMPF